MIGRLSWLGLAGALVLAVWVAGAAEPQRLTNAPAGLHNVFQVSPRVVSGSQPEGEESFAWLAARGIRTVVSVDGARPDVEAARRHGLRYVHLPVGYDGVPAQRVAELSVLATNVSGPIYVHCHHGKHRGPAAAALLCELSEGMSAATAEAYLVQAGTAAEYAGLYRAVREFRGPDAERVAKVVGPLPEVARTPDLVQAMVSVDACLESLRACQKAGWRTPAGQPDVSPAHEALQLMEQFRELGRQEGVTVRGAAFVELMRQAELEAAALRQILGGKTGAPGSGPGASADAAFRRLGETCADCHRGHRN